MSTDQPAASTPREDLEIAYGDLVDALEVLEHKRDASLAALGALQTAEQQRSLATAEENAARVDAQTAAEVLKQTIDRLTHLPAAGLT